MHTGSMNMNTDVIKNKDVLPNLKKSTPAVMPNMNKRMNMNRFWKILISEWYDDYQLQIT
jgi:hypothetical protein